MRNKVKRNNVTTYVERNKLITDNKKLTQTFNEFFASSAEDLRITSDFSSNLNPNNINDILLQYEIHPSITAARQRMLVTNSNFTFTIVSRNKIGVIILNFKCPKIYEQEF